MIKQILLIWVAGLMCLTACKTQRTGTASRAFAEYSLLELPFNARMTNPDRELRWQDHALSDASRKALGAHIPGEGGHPIGKVVHSSEAFLCLTYVKLAEVPQIVLTTHKTTGELIDGLVIAQDAQNGAVGYGGSVAPTFRVFRSEMFYIKDERTGKLRPEADHEDVFVVGEDGQIAERKR